MNIKQNHKKIAYKFTQLLAISAAALLTACASKPSVNTDAVAATLNTNTTNNAGISFPEPSSAWLSEGDFVNVDNLRKVAPGLTKDQLYYLINRPHFSEGIFGVRTWNYLFNFRTGVNNEYVTCQYQVKFDSNVQIASTHWKDQECLRFLEAPKPAEVIVREVVREPSIQAPAAIQRFTIAGDVLFAYNRHTLADLRLGGRAELDRILAELRTYKSIDLVRVIGHTDPLAGFEYNFDLAYKRANTVGNYFVSNGISREVLQARSAGETEVVKATDACGAKYANATTGKNNAFLQECLAPNRRVVVEVTGIKN